MGCAIGGGGGGQAFVDQYVFVSKKSQRSKIGLHISINNRDIDFRPITLLTGR